MKSTITKTNDFALFLLREDEFRQQVEEYAAMLGWLTYHTHDSRKSDKGFPDTVLVRERLILVEFKIATGKLSREQVAWRDALLAAGQEYYVWKPDSWPEIEGVLAWPVAAYPQGVR